MSTSEIEAVAIDLKLASRDIRDLKIACQRDGENIRTLARIAERRLADLEGQE